ncbi:Uncharacterised protein [Salmonella enterica]|nr:Uncharacterised protein [Salmonella enterica]VFS08077.1 Uncharacterised protein [Salmonella enterica subsp. houtenae]
MVLPYLKSKYYINYYNPTIILHFKIQELF